LAISLSPEAAGLPPGLYTAIVTISPPDQIRAPQFVTVLLEQTDPAAAPEPELSPGGLFFKTRASAGLTPAQTLNVFATIDPPFHVSAQTTDGKNWLQVTPQSGNAAAAVANQLSVQVNPAGLTPGVYRGEVDVELGGNIIGANVTLVVLPEPRPPAMGQDAGRQDDQQCTPTALAITLTSPTSHFSTVAGFPETVVASITDDCGNPMPGATVTSTFSSGDAQLNLDASSPDGVFAATWVPANPSPQVVITVDATFTGTPDGSILRRTDQFIGGVNPAQANGPPMVTSIGGNDPAANPNPDPNAPVTAGGTGLIVGSNLGTTPTTTSVLVAGANPRNATLLLVSGTSVTFTVPTVVGPRVFPVVVTANGLSSAQPLSLRVQ
jgi:hypothetical protein